MIYLGADHGGFELKEKIKEWLSEWNMPCVDMGADSFQPDDDYPQYAHAVAAKVQENSQENKGVLICRSGGGMVIAANKHIQVRAVYVFDETSASHAREHNDANVASFAAEWTDEILVKQSLHAFLTTSFSKEKRHARRVQALEVI